MNLNMSLVAVRGEINAIHGCLASQGVLYCILATKSGRSLIFMLMSERKKNTIAFDSKRNWFLP